MRVVIMAPNWLGDAVMALPAIRDVRRHFSGAQLVVAARPSVSPLFRAVSGIDEVAAPANMSGDVGILFPNSFRSAWLLKRAGVKERWGYRADFRWPLLTRAVGRPKRKVHFGEYYQHLVRALGIETGPLTPQVSPPAAKIEAAARLLEERGWTPGQALVGIAPGAAFGHAKRWPSSRFQRLAESLRDEMGAVCVVLGRAEDREAGQEVPGINLVGHTDLLMLMGVLSHCRALVANDSGALHLAAAMGIPVTGIYGPTDQRYSTPLTSSITEITGTTEGTVGAAGDLVNAVFEPVFCRPCGMPECPIDHRCMTRIQPERVFESVRRQLQQEGDVSQ